MALKVLLLRKKLTDKQNELRGLETAAEALKTREAELEASIEEVQTEEERSVVEEAVSAFEAERDANTEAQEALRSEIDQIEAEMRELEETAKRRLVPTRGRPVPGGGGRAQWTPAPVPGGRARLWERGWERVAAIDTQGRQPSASLGLNAGCEAGQEPW